MRAPLRKDPIYVPYLPFLITPRRDKRFFGRNVLHTTSMQNRRRGAVKKKPNRVSVYVCVCAITAILCLVRNTGRPTDSLGVLCPTKYLLASRKVSCLPNTKRESALLLFAPPLRAHCKKPIDSILRRNTTAQYEVGHQGDAPPRRRGLARPRSCTSTTPRRGPRSPPSD